MIETVCCNISDNYFSW